MYKDFLSRCDQIRRKLKIWSHLLKISLMGNFIFCAASSPKDRTHSSRPQLKVFLNKVISEITKSQRLS